MYKIVVTSKDDRSLTVPNVIESRAVLVVVAFFNSSSSLALLSKKVLIDAPSLFPQFSTGDQKRRKCLFVGRGVIIHSETRSCRDSLRTLRGSLDETCFGDPKDVLNPQVTCRIFSPASSFIRTRYITQSCPVHHAFKNSSNRFGPR